MPVIPHRPARPLSPLPHRLTLALLLACASATPVVGLAASGGVQMLQWSDYSVQGTVGETEAKPGDVWQRVREGFRIDDTAAPNPLVAVHEAWYAARPESLRRMVERSRRYLYHIVEEVDRRAMPMEIALLPMIESAFNPTALSPSAASGIWQFIPSTGRLYGLKQDPWYDGRRDFTAATKAALDYLGKLYLDFGDWQLALAAYNCGEGCVARAIQKNVQEGLPTDYASLTLPNETRHYVPKLLAVRNLVRNPEQYGIAIDALPNEPYFNQVTVNASLDVHSAARLANMSSDEFLALNAAFPRNLIRSDTPVNLLVPVDKADQFQRNLDAGNWDSWQPYVAKKGERPEAIAARLGVSLARLEEHNQFHLKRGKLVSDQTILVPVKGRAATRVPPPAVVTSLPATHEVQRGDTLFNIARRYGLGVADLQAANPDLGDVLRLGQSLRLPSTAAVSMAPAQPVRFEARVRAATPERYTVQRGDTLHAIAARFNVTLDDLKAWNPAFHKSPHVRAGESIFIQR